ncbi:MAG: hypothetical protein ACLRRB_01520 [Ruminococcus sp.]
MKVIVVKDYDAVSKEAFNVMKEVVTSKKDAVLGLATGSSPIGLYKNMIQDHKDNGGIQAMHSASPSIWMNMLVLTETIRNPTGHSCMKTCLRELTYRKIRFMYLMEAQRKIVKAMKRQWKMSV